MWEQLGPQLNEALVNVATGLVALGAAAATYYLKKGADKLTAETGRIKDQTKIQMLYYALDRLEETAEKVVLEIEQTIAGELRSAIKNGKNMDRTELLALGHEACKKILKAIEPDVVQVLQENLGNLEEYVMSTVEARVKLMKDEDAKGN